MKILEPNRHDNLSFEETINQLIQENQCDVLFLYVIIGVPKSSFGLSGLKLIYAVHKILLAITKAGAKPVRNPTHPGTRYRIAADYGDTPEAITRTTMRRWQAGGYEQYGGENDVWFAVPPIYNRPWTQADMDRDLAWRTPAPANK